MHRFPMVMAMNNQVSAMSGNDFLEFRRIHQPPTKARANFIGRVVNHHHAGQIFQFRRAQKPREGRHLRLAQPARGQKRRCRHTGAQADQRHRPAYAQIGKTRPLRLIRLHPSAEIFIHKGQIAAHINIMIARHKTHIRRGAQRLQPAPCGRKFGPQANVENIAGHGAMIHLLRPHIGHQRRQNLHVMNKIAAIVPVEKTGEALAEQFGKPGARQGPDMGIREMGKTKNHILF